MQDNRCEAHQREYQDNQLLSPCRAKCHRCGKKRLNGYSNPNHVCNPFGYLYLFPSICDHCSRETKQCMWCKYVFDRSMNEVGEKAPVLK